MHHSNFVYLESLGCAKNLVDSEIMLGCLDRAGYRLSAAPHEAELIIVNTCAFIEEACREAIERILVLAEHKRSGTCKFLVVAGCLPQRYQADLARELPEVDLFLGSGEFQNISRHLDRLREGRRTPRVRTSRATFLPGPGTPRLLSAPGSSAYVKIAEGCSHGCTFCTIPGIKGPYQSRSPDSVVREVRHLTRSGIREINLVSQDTTRFPDLAGLLKKLVRIPGLRWIRLLYGHPRHLSAEVIRLLANEEKICRYLDLPLQHISDPVLERMGRRFSRKKTEALLKAVRRASPDIAIRTTFLVGFPGETEADFEALLVFVKNTGFEHVGAFQYRSEEGTPASRLPGKIPEKTKQARFQRLMRLQAPISRAGLRRRVGKHLEVLVEGAAPRSPYRVRARTEFQAPEVDGVVLLKEDVPVGEFVDVKITRSLTYDLVGRVGE